MRDLYGGEAVSFLRTRIERQNGDEGGGGLAHSLAYERGWTSIFKVYLDVLLLLRLA